MDLIQQSFSRYNYSTPHFSLNNLHTYARLVDIHDGDTISVIIPVFNHFYKFQLRIAGIDTCEITSHNPDLHLHALQARNRILQICTNNIVTSFTSKKDIIQELDNYVYLLWIECLDFDKFGRLLANVYTSDKKLCISTILLNERLAYPYQGKNKMTDDELLNYIKN